MPDKYTMLVAATVLAAAAMASPTVTATAQGNLPRIVNGLNSHSFATTGALMKGSAGSISANNADSWCSGTLIGCQTFLTAAHCVFDDTNPSHYWVFLQHAGTFAASSITVHPSYTDTGFPQFDVAVIKLATPVTGIDPTELATSATPVGTPGSIAGFGQTTGTAGDYGIKRYGAVVTSDCTGVLSGLGNTELVCWNFANPVGAPGAGSNTCNGASGGPLFVDLGAGEVIAGVTSGGINGSCLATDNSYDANVFTWSSFITAQLGADSTAACGGLPIVGSVDVNVVGNDGNLSNSNPDDTIAINVTGTPNEMRVALKGEDNGSLDVNFYVKQGASAGPANFDCKSDGSANVGSCVFATPNPGQWTVFVERASGAGEYQVTTSIFAGPPPVCGNNVTESGEQCDGSDDSACSGLCQVDCSCPAPFCGNNVVESGEQCDGSDPGSCPTGACGVGCACPAPVCGNNVVETGEQCDGSDDSACPGLCDGTCSCPTTCNIDDLLVRKGKADAKRFIWKADLFNLAGTYDGIDPRNGFVFSVSQGANSAAANIPAGDPGWAKSKPSKGRYKWKGLIGGIRSVKATDKSFKKGVWQIKVRGKQVLGADQLDVINFFADVQLDVDGTCASGTY